MLETKQRLYCKRSYFMTMQMRTTTLAKLIHYDNEMRSQHTASYITHPTHKWRNCLVFCPKTKGKAVVVSSPGPDRVCSRLSRVPAGKKNWESNPEIWSIIFAITLPPNWWADFIGFARISQPVHVWIWGSFPISIRGYADCQWPLWRDQNLVLFQIQLLNLGANLKTARQ